MPVEDKQIGLRASREFTKRMSLDGSDVHVHVSNGVVYLSGKLKLTRAEANVDIRKEVEVVERSIRTLPGVREIVNELDLPHY